MSFEPQPLRRGVRRSARIVPLFGPATNRRWIVAILAAAGLGAALRSWRIAAGLPDFLEEAFPLRLALGMKDAGGAVDWNPHFFNYPSLSIYVHFVVQQTVFGIGMLLGAWRGWPDYLVLFQIDPTPMVLAARGVGIAGDTLTITAAGMLAERLQRGAGVCAALLVSFAPILIETSHGVFCDPLMVALALGALERTVAYLRDGNPRTLNLAALLGGFAAGAKYPAAALVVALSAALFLRDGTPGWRRLPLVLGLSAAGFVVTTPFAVLDPAAFLRDFRFESEHATAGHLGTVGRHAFRYHLGNLLTNLGPAAIVVLLAAPLAAVRRHDLRAPFIVLGIAFAAFAVPIAMASIEAARYLAPVVAIASVPAAVAALALTAELPERFRRAATATLAAVMLLPPAFAGWRAATAGADSTHRLAKQWCMTHLDGQLLMEESYGAPLLTRMSLEEFTATPEFQAASAALQRRLLDQPVARVVAIPFGASGGATATVEPPGRSPVVLDVFEHASDLNGAFYDPRLLACADYVLTSSSVRARYESDAHRYPAPIATYRLLDGHAEQVARFSPHGAVTGAELIVYRIGPEFRTAAGGDPDPLWWASGVPEEFRRRASDLLGEPDDASHLQRADGTASGWVRSLDDLHAGRILEFSDRLMMELMALERYAPAAAIAGGTLEVHSGHVAACLVASLALRRLKHPEESLAIIERTRAALGAESDPSIDLERARALIDLGRRSEATLVLRELVARLAADDPIAGEARRLLGG